MTDLSPMAQAVLDAYFSSLHKTPHQSVAAALRAAAVQLTSAKASDQLRAIAAELETSTSENR